MCAPQLFPALGSLFAGGAAAGTSAAGTGAAASTGLSLGSVLKLVGAGIGAVSTVQQANAAARSLEKQAEFSERQARIERQRGAFEAKRARERARRLAGSQVANFAASGVLIDGSTGSVIDDSAAEAALEVESILYGSTLRADNEMFEANMARVNANTMRRSAPLAAIAPVIRGASTIDWGGVFS